MRAELSRIISILVVTTTAMLISYSLTQYMPSQNLKDKEIEMMSKQIDKLQAQVSIMQSYMVQDQNMPIVDGYANRVNYSASSDVHRLEEMSSAISQMSSKVSLIEDNHKKLNDKMDLIESAVIENPDRALALITLREDIDNLKDTREQDSNGLRREMDRLYDFNKWFLVLMFTLNLGVVGILASHFLRKPEASPKMEQRSENNIRP